MFKRVYCDKDFLEYAAPFKVLSFKVTLKSALKSENPCPEKRVEGQKTFQLRHRKFLKLDSHLI